MSIWLNNLNYKESIALDKNISVDVLIIGGGITGISACYHLRNSNLKIALVEKNKIGEGITSRTTGKLTFLQETIYSDLCKYFDINVAQKYYNSQIEAINLVKNIVLKENIDCNFELVKSYLFTNDLNKIKKIKDEKNILTSWHVNVHEDNNLGYGIYVDNTYVFHPLKYLIALKKICEDKINFYENTKIIEINKDNDFYICKTPKYNIKAQKVILALHYPYFIFPYLFPLKTHLEKSYIGAYKTDKNLKFSAINIDKPCYSIRYYEDKNNIYKIVLNNSHNLAFKNNDIKYFNQLKSNNKFDYLWSNIDIITCDKLPLIGSISDNLYLATGYNTWGMTNGSLAGKILSDIINNKDNKYVSLFNPNRFNLKMIKEWPIIVGSNIKSFVGSKVNKNKAWYSKNVCFKKINGKSVAIYIDKNNVKHIVYNKCPHLKCSLIFNEEELTWDCPCHGSRFNVDGKCILGPSNYDIGYKG